VHDEHEINPQFFDVWCTVHDEHEINPHIPTYMHNFIVLTRFGLATGHPQGVFSGERCLPSGYQMKDNAHH
jgi:hypothetical protein